MLLRLDPTIANPDDAPSVTRHLCIVSDHQERKTFDVQFLEQAQKFGASAGIQIAGWLVGQ